MTGQRDPAQGMLSLAIVGAMAWLIPGGGYFVLGDKRRGAVVLVTISLTFLTGIYVGSIGVIDSLHAKPWYFAQVMNTPAVMLIGNHVAGAYRKAKNSVDEARHTGDQRAIVKAVEMMQSNTYRVYGRPNEVGQIYTSIAGLLNLLCIVNAMYLTHKRHLDEGNP